MHVEVVYMGPDIEFIEEVELLDNSTVKQAIITSKLLDRCPDVSLDKNVVGVFGKQVSMDTVLTRGDRIEVYRSLAMDPMEARRLRAIKTTSKD